MVQPIVGDMHGLRLFEMDLEWKIVESLCLHNQDNKGKTPETFGQIVDSSGMVTDPTIIPRERLGALFGGICWLRTSVRAGLTAN